MHIMLTLYMCTDVGRLSHNNHTVLNKMAMERVVWYLWVGSLVLAIPNNSGQLDSGQSDGHLVTCTPKNMHKPCRDESHVNVLVSIIMFVSYVWIFYV